MYEVTQIFFKFIFRYLTLFSVFVLVSFGVGQNPQSKSGAVVRSVPTHEESFFSGSSSIQTGKKWRLLNLNTKTCLPPTFIYLPTKIYCHDGGWVREYYNYSIQVILKLFIRSSCALAVLDTLGLWQIIPFKVVEKKLNGCETVGLGLILE